MPTAKRSDKAALERFEAAFAKDFGEDTLRRTSVVKPYEVIPTGSLTLDFALGVGGYIEGRLTELWGVDGSGKTSMSLIAAANAQRKHPGKMVGFIDMEQSLDLDWATKLGVDLALMYHVQPNSAEDVADVLKKMLASGLMSMVIVDSIGGMVTAAEQEKDAEDSVMGKMAQVVTRMVKLAAVEARKTGSVVLLINQVRANLAYGADQTTGGGWALKHATTHKIKFKRTGTPPYTIKKGDQEEQVGVEIAAVVEKNKVAPPRRSAIFTLFNQATEKFGPLGIDQADEAAILGARLGLIQRSGAWYHLTDGTKVNGRLELLDYLRRSPGSVDEIRHKAIESKAAEVIPDTVPEPS